MSATLTRHSSLGTRHSAKRSLGTRHSSLRKAVTRHSAKRSLVTALALAFAAAAAAANAVPAPYGVCAHLHRVRDPEFRAKECRRIAEAGIGRVRFDFEWWRIQKGPGEPFDFSHYDAVMADAEDAGLAVLPIIYGNPLPKWADPIWEHLDEWGRYVEAVVAHYGDRLPDIEIWNEQNLKGFWHHEPDPKRYAEALRVAYGAAKRANPRVRVLFGGTAGTPWDFIEGVYEAGGGSFFDVMNVHPYNHPRAPEGNLDARLEKLRALMAKYGDAGKPIVITEHGWPTHHMKIDSLYILRAGLKIARPEQKLWRVVLAVTEAGPDGAPPKVSAEDFGMALPPGSTVEACFGARLRERLRAGDVDLVVYPFDETFPVDTVEDVLAFVNAGGVLADFGGMPMWYPARETEPGVFKLEEQDADGRFRNRLRVGVAAFWTNPALPRSGAAFATEAALAAGFKGDPAGIPVARFQTPELLREGDEFIPILTLKDADGHEAAGASVTRLNGGANGCVIVCGVLGRGLQSAGEDGQARYLPRAMAIAFAEGVEHYCWYEFRSPENDPLYSEDHFGIVHRDLSPKPAFQTCRVFTEMRPAGSVQAPGPWRDEAREFHFPQWTRPDGTKAGILWTTGKPGMRELAFDSDSVTFSDAFGRKLPARRTAHRMFAVEVSDSPLYFTGGKLICTW